VSSSPHSDPGYDSDSTSTVEAKAGDHDDGGDKDDAGFDSDDALSLPAFYENPHASRSDETLGTIGSIGSIGTVGTMGTMDTMSAALRSLGPAQRPTIRGIRSRVASVDKNGGVTMTERRPSNGAGGVLNGPRQKAKAEPMKTQAYTSVDDARQTQHELDFKTKGVLRPKDQRSLETPSSLSLSMNMGSRRALSSAVAAHKALVGGNDDVHGSPISLFHPDPASVYHPTGVRPEVQISTPLI
jgi:hypothetical protein